MTNTDITGLLKVDRTTSRNKLKKLAAEGMIKRIQAGNKGLPDRYEPV